MIKIIITNGEFNVITTNHNDVQESDDKLFGHDPHVSVYIPSNLRLYS